MRKIQTHITSLLFSGILSIPLLLIVFIQLWQIHVQHQAEERLENLSLQTIVVGAADIRWEQQGKEVSISGALFDVKDFTRSGDKLILTGLWDTKETLIKNLLHKQVGNTRSGIIQLMVVGQFFVAIPIFMINSSFRKFITRTFCSIQSHYAYPKLEVIAPPPRWVLVGNG